MPVLTCGGMRFQQSWQEFEKSGLDADNQANLDATVRRAFDLGINHFETARGYGSSELQLGLVLPTLPRDEIIVQTKIGVKDSEEEFLSAFETSMGHLQLDHVDLLSVHGINGMADLDRTMNKGTIAACRKLVAEGRARHIGFSTHAGPEVIIAALQTDAFSYVNLHWYYIDQRNWPAIAEAASLDVGVFIISPVDKAGQLFKPPAKLVDLCAPYTPMGFNDLFCLQHSAIQTLSIGAARPSDFDAHMAILPDLDRKPAEKIEPILNRLQDALVQALGDDWVEHWADGVPQPEDHPEEVSIYHILRLHNLAKAFDMVDFGRYRYNLLGEGGLWFPGIKAEDLDGALLAKRLAGNPRLARIETALRETHEMLSGEKVIRLSESET